MAGNFTTLWLTDPEFSALKDLNPFKIVSKVQDASSILRVIFAHSNWPHLHRDYLVTVRFHLILAVAVYVSYNIATTQEPLLMAQVW